MTLSPLLIHWLKVSILFSSCGNILEWKLSMKLKRIYGDASPIRKRWKSLKHPKIPLEVWVEEKLIKPLHPWYGTLMDEVWLNGCMIFSKNFHLAACFLVCHSSTFTFASALTLGEPRVLLSVDLNRFQHRSVSPYQRRGSLVAARVSTNHEC